MNTIIKAITNYRYYTLFALGGVAFTMLIGEPTPYSDCYYDEWRWFFTLVLSKALALLLFVILAKLTYHWGTEGLIPLLFTPEADEDSDEDYYDSDENNNEDDNDNYDISSKL